MPYGNASILLLDEGSEATEPYNKFESLRIYQFPCILAVTAVILFRFENRLFCKHRVQFSNSRLFTNNLPNCCDKIVEEFQRRLIELIDLHYWERHSRSY